MRRFEFYKKFRESFSLKVFGVFAVFIIIVSSVFTAYFIYHQNKNIREDIIQRGVMLSDLLAYNSRTGAFAERESLLSDTVHGIMNQRDVLLVSIFTADKKVLLVEKKNPSLKLHTEMKDDGHKGFMAKLINSRSLEIIENKDTIEFLRAITLEISSRSEESLYFDIKDPGKTEKIIGYVNVMLDKGAVNRTIRSTLIHNAIIAALFLLSGVIVIYISAGWVTRPLEALTDAVEMLGQGASEKKVSVRSRDEIGKLAEAFNAMAENLSKREKEKTILEEKLAHAQKMEAIGQFAGGIAHDFNNRLTAITNYGHLLRMKMKEDDLLRGYIEQMLNSCAKAADLTQSLLTFGRRDRITLAPIDLNDIITTTEKVLGRIIGDNIEVETSLADGRVTVMADGGQMEQVFMNLAKNAKDAMPEGGRLIISTEFVDLDNAYIRTQGYIKPGMYAAVSVTDTGIGMDAITRQRIFEPFFTTKEVGKGTGLGLSIVYGIIEQHNGYIDCYSEPGKGTTFKIYLPLTEIAFEGLRDETSIPPARGTEIVLLAEDNEDVRATTREVLEEFGYKVITAVNGEDAIIKFMENKDRVGLLLLDVVMPKKNGKDVYETIKKVKPDIKALFSSGFTADIINKNPAEDGLNFISKPSSPMYLLKKVREVLDA
ncbi:MAG: response regulator [Nitrospirae bacterium]|nr:response regulator [Nitrospirota bacterium]